MLLEQRAHGVRRARALAQPVVHALFVDLHVSRLRTRIVRADVLDEAAFTRRARFGDHHSEKRLLGRSHPPHTNNEHLSSPSCGGSERTRPTSPPGLLREAPPTRVPSPESRTYLVLISPQGPPFFRFRPGSCPAAAFSRIACSASRPSGRRPLSAFGMPGNPPWPIICSTFFISVNCLRRRFTSSTEVPLPPAIRLRRLPLMILSLRRSSAVIEEMIASTRPICFSSGLFAASCFCMPPRPGIIPMMLSSGPIFLMVFSCLRKSSSVNAFLRSFSSSSSASS